MNEIKAISEKFGIPEAALQKLVKDAVKWEHLKMEYVTQATIFIPEFQAKMAEILGIDSCEKLRGLICNGSIPNYAFSETLREVSGLE